MSLQFYRYYATPSYNGTARLLRYLIVLFSIFALILFLLIVTQSPDINLITLLLYTANLFIMASLVGGDVLISDDTPPQIYLRLGVITQDSVAIYYSVHSIKMIYFILAFVSTWVIGVAIEFVARGTITLGLFVFIPTYVVFTFIIVLFYMTIKQSYSRRYGRPIPKRRPVTSQSVRSRPIQSNKGIIPSFCPSCGTSLQNVDASARRFCPRCGKKVS